MDRPSAEKIMPLLVGLDRPLGEILSVVEQLPPSEEKSVLIRAIGDVMGRVFTELMVPIILQHPDLDPDGQVGWPHNSKCVLKRAQPK